MRHDLQSPSWRAVHASAASQPLAVLAAGPKANHELTIDLDHSIDRDPGSAIGQSEAIAWTEYGLSLAVRPASLLVGILGIAVPQK